MNEIIYEYEVTFQVLSKSQNLGYWPHFCTKIKLIKLWYLVWVKEGHEVSFK